MEFSHKTVMLKETLDFLNINKDGTYWDAVLRLHQGFLKKES